MIEPLEYALGHTAAELRRLEAQARLINPISRRFFTSAGIGPGMRVLDVGTGAGDVAMLLADLVGPTGQVIGTDLATTAVETARRRVAAAGYNNIDVRHGDPAELDFEPFDAIAGRYVLQFRAEPGTSLARIIRQLRPGGVVVFHELDWDGARSTPVSPTYDQVCKWCSSTIEASGAQIRLGAALSSVFQAAKLPPPELRLESVIASGPDTIDAIHLVTDLLETLLPAMLRLGFVGEGEVDLPNLPGQILEEVGEQGTLIGRSEVGAWCRG
jgi:protein-L-isoaspartate O-methyltransferase